MSYNLHKIFLPLILFLLFISLFSGSSQAGSQNLYSELNEIEIMPLSEVEPGMQGKGRTVIQGQKIEEFDIEVLSILQGQELSDHLILFEASGDVIDNSGGIAAGMSGSPVFVDNRLLGAVSYGWDNTDHRKGMLTPAGEMLRLIENEAGEKSDSDFDIKSYRSPELLELDGKELDTFYVLDDGINEKRVQNLEQEAVFVPVRTPVMFSGLSGRAYDFMVEKLRSSNFFPVRSGGFYRSKDDLGDDLKPGSAVGIQLTRGDIDITAIGTLTYLQDSSLLAFGHPFMNRGNVSFMFSSAYIHDVIKSRSMPFKLGSAVELLGSVTQDRPAGISGSVGQFPSISSLRIFVNDLDLDQKNDLYVQLVPDQNLFVNLFTGVALQAIDQSIQRQGRGMAVFEYSISGAGIPEGPVVRRNTYYSSSDIAVAALYEIIDMVYLLTHNPYRKVEIYDIRMDIEIWEEERIAGIEGVEVDEEYAYPGGRLPITVILKPYRSEEITKEIVIDIPDELSSDRYFISVYGGQDYYPGYDNEDDYNMFQEVPMGGAAYELREEIDYLLDKPMNNELVVRISTPYPHGEYIPPSADDEQYGQSKEKEELQSEIGSGGNTFFTDIKNNDDQKDNDYPSDEPSRIEHVSGHESDEEGNDLFEFEKVIETSYVLHGSDGIEIEIVGSEGEKGEFDDAGEQEVFRE